VNATTTWSWTPPAGGVILPVVSPLFFGVHVELDLQAFRDLLEQRHFFPWNSQSNGQIPNVLANNVRIACKSAFCCESGGWLMIIFEERCLISKASDLPGSTGFEPNFRSLTLPETDMAPENRWLEYQFPFGMSYFQGLC